MAEFVKSFIADARERRQFRSLRGIKPLNTAECIYEGRKYLNFSSNNYLALSEHPAIKEESIRWTEKYGVGTGASRLVTGTIDEVLELEARIARWKKTEAAIILGSGYLANTGIISAIADRNSLIFADKLNHASLNNGCLLSGAKFLRYKHNDPRHLRNIISQYGITGRKLIVTDTIFSMDGDVADLQEICAIALEFDAMLYIDDAHGTGVFGECGEGFTDPNADIIMGTFSKALGAYGAYAACSADMKDYLINRCGPFIYSTALPPSVYGSISAAIKILDSEELAVIRGSLLEKASNLRDQLSNIGYDIGNSTTHIIPVIVKDNETVLKLAAFLMERGIWAAAIRPPTVPENTARIRISLNTAHTEEHISRLVDAFKEARSLV